MADKTIRVNDPLTVGGYTFHQNGFGPAPDMVIRDEAGKPLWSGPIPMTDQAAGFPFAEFAVPGRDVALQLLLQRATDGTGILLVLPFRSLGTNPDGSPNVVGLEPVALARGESATPDGTDFSVELRGFSRLHAADREEGPRAGDRLGGVRVPDRRDRRSRSGCRDAASGAGSTRDGRLSLVMRADRYVDAGREFGRLLDDLVASRRAPPTRAAPAPAPSADPAADAATVAAPSRTRPATSSVESAGYTPRYRPGPGRVRVPSTAPAVRRAPRQGPEPDFHPAPVTSSCKLRRDLEANQRPSTASRSQGVTCPLVSRPSRPSPPAGVAPTTDYMEHAGEEIYGEYVFHETAQRQYLAKPIFQAAAAHDRRPRAVRSGHRRRRRARRQGVGDGPRRDALHPLVRADDGLDRREARLVPEPDRRTATRSPSSRART